MEDIYYNVKLVALGEIEVNIYSSPNLWEVFIQFGKISGVSYAEKENIYIYIH